MRALAVLVICAATLISGWILKDDLPDGLYHIEAPDGEDESAAIIKRATSFDDFHPDTHVGFSASSVIRKRGSYYGDIVIPKGGDVHDVGRIQEDEWSAPDSEKPPNLAISHEPVEKPPYAGSKIDPMLEPVTSDDLEGSIPMPVKKWDCDFAQPRFPRREYLEARENLFAYCATWRVPRNTVHIALAKSGGVAIYMCNWKGDHHRARACARREWEWTEFHWLDPRCGELTAGWVEALGKHERRYGRAWVGTDICGLGDRARALHRQMWAGKPPEPGHDEDAPAWYKHAQDFAEQKAQDDKAWEQERFNHMQNSTGTARVSEDVADLQREEELEKNGLRGVGGEDEGGGGGGGGGEKEKREVASDMPEVTQVNATHGLVQLYAPLKPERLMTKQERIAAAQLHEKLVDAEDSRMPEVLSATELYEQAEERKAQEQERKEKEEEEKKRKEEEKKKEKEEEKKKKEEEEQAKKDAEALAKMAEEGERLEAHHDPGRHALRVQYDQIRKKEADLKQQAQLIADQEAEVAAIKHSVAKAAEKADREKLANIAATHETLLEEAAELVEYREEVEREREMRRKQRLVEEEWRVDQDLKRLQKDKEEMEEMMKEEEEKEEKEKEEKEKEKEDEDEDEKGGLTVSIEEEMPEEKKESREEKDTGKKDKGMGWMMYDGPECDEGACLGRRGRDGGYRGDWGRDGRRLRFDRQRRYRGHQR